MALQIHTASFLTNRPSPYPLLSPPKPKLTTIRSQTPNDDQTPPKKRAQPGLGFGSSSSSSSAPSKSSNASNTSKKKQKGDRERATVVRRSPVEKPSFITSKEKEEKAKELRKNESAFLLAWLGLGGVILVEGIVLAASGFLPEEWDRFFVKYLYPSFTPTVFLFVAGTGAYGVFKYLQNENLKDQN